jgi:hypothetical protein
VLHEQYEKTAGSPHRYLTASFQLDGVSAFGDNFDLMDQSPEIVKSSAKTWVTHPLYVAHFSQAPRRGRTSVPLFESPSAHLDQYRRNSQD